jgi:hypothetical protein
MTTSDEGDIPYINDMDPVPSPPRLDFTDSTDNDEDDDTCNHRLAGISL